MQNEFREISDAVTAHVEYEQNNQPQSRNATNRRNNSSPIIANSIGRVDYRNRLDVTHFPYRRTNQFAEHMQRFMGAETPRQPTSFRKKLMKPHGCHSQ
jgi:hypothetical protein